MTRQSASSSSAKGWLLPVTTAAFGFALTQHLWPLALLGVIAVILFAYLDANYLRSEKAFRRLYNNVARAERIVPRFTLDPTDANEPLPVGTPEKTRWQKLKKSYVAEWSVWRSWSIAPFYAAMIVLGIGVLIAAAVTRPAPAHTRDNPESPPAPQTTVITTSVPVPKSVPVTPRP